MEATAGSVLESRVWERGRAALGVYKHRQPEGTSLYRLVYQYRDEFERSWEERFQSKYGVLRHEVLEALDEYLNCGILAHGCVQVYCDQCRHSEVLGFSCRKRGICPSCGMKHAVMFAEHMYHDVLERVPHRHTGFTIPKRLRKYILFHRELADVLFDAAWGAVKELYEAVKPGCKVGAVFELHTTGDNLQWHPHLHSMQTNGCFDAQGNFHELSLDIEKLGLLFGVKVLKKLKKYYKTIPGLEEACEQIASQEHSGFGAWQGEVIKVTDKNYQLFLSRYLDKHPLSAQRIELAGDKVHYHAKSGEVSQFDPLEFLALLGQHVPNKWESRRRYLGYYSHRDRGRRKREAEEKAAAEKQDQSQSGIKCTPATPELKKKASRRWAELIKKVFNVDPLVCPKCGATMRIKSFIVDQHEIQKLLKNLGVPGWTKPEPIKRAPPDSDQWPMQ